MARATGWWLGLGSVAVIGTACSSTIAPPQANFTQLTATPSAAPTASTAPGGGPATAPKVSFTADVVPLLRQHCASCHSPGGSVPEHGYWFNAAGEPEYKNIKDHAGLMIRYINEGKMPPDDPKSVSPNLVKFLDAWRKDGMKLN